MPCRIVVADDNRDSAETLAELLALEGHVVRVAHDGPQALQTIVSFQPHVAFVDIVMPGMDGYEVAKRVRATVLPFRITLVAVTGYGHHGVVRAIAAGFDHHLLKPLEPAIMQQILQKAGRS